MTVRDLLYHGRPCYPVCLPNLPVDLQGWSSTHPIFAKLIARTRPSLIIEVGSWKGASAIHMASLCDAAGLETEILCVDTWLGDDHCRSTPEWAPFATDLARLYRQFVANVMRTMHTDRIIPLQLDSRLAATFLRAMGVVAQLVYIDGSHQYQDVLDDVENYYGLLCVGGIIFGDDWTFPEVRDAMGTFAIQIKRQVTIQHPHWWIER